uniref:Kazal-like domain-containing protein n=2 Tax=Nemorhina TaxID=44051 RepID=A0A1B0AW23_9MUSC
MNAFQMKLKNMKVSLIFLAVLLCYAEAGQTQLLCTIVPYMNSQPHQYFTTKPTPKRSMKDCDLLCTKFNFDPVCATNGFCVHEFANQCVLDVFNCQHPTKRFMATKDERCRMHWLKRCDPDEVALI